MGGAVVLGADRENLCRPATSQEVDVFGGLRWIVESQGLPNLIHELVHALFLGRLDDDHGFDYGEIPLDLERSNHRRHLWEELACCCLSSVFAAVWAEDPEAFGAAWFVEQFEIQGVFHGLDHDLAGFREHIDAQLRDPARRAELVTTVAQGHRLVESALAGVGAAIPLPACDPVAIWTRYREGW